MPRARQSRHAPRVWKGRGRTCRMAARTARARVAAAGEHRPGCVDAGIFSPPFPTCFPPEAGRREADGGFPLIPFRHRPSNWETSPPRGFGPSVFPPGIPIDRSRQVGACLPQRGLFLVVPSRSWYSSTSTSTPLRCQMARDVFLAWALFRSKRPSGPCRPSGRSAAAAGKAVEVAPFGPSAIRSSARRWPGPGDVVEHVGGVQGSATRTESPLG